MRFVILGIALLMFVAWSFPCPSFLLTDSIWFSIIRWILMGIFSVAGIVMVYIGIGDKKKEAQREIIKDIESEGFVVSVAVVERVENS